MRPLTVQANGWAMRARMLLLRSHGCPQAMPARCDGAEWQMQQVSSHFSWCLTQWRHRSMAAAGECDRQPAWNWAYFPWGGVVSHGATEATSSTTPRNRCRDGAPSGGPHCAMIESNCRGHLCRTTELTSLHPNPPHWCGPMSGAPQGWRSSHAQRAPRASACVVRHQNVT